MSAAGIAAFGPSKAAAEIEASKVFAKDLMVRHGIPTAKHGSFDSMLEAGTYIAEHPEPLVIKADGLAAGKGAILTRDSAEAFEVADALLCDRVFGEAGARIVVEERLSGRETSAQAFTDGRTVVSMPLSCDHKAVFDYDEGPNTGGMGAYSPPGWLSPETVEWIHEHITRRDRAGDGGRGPAVSRRHLPGPAGHRRGAERPGVQLSLRRPGDAGDPAAPEERPAGDTVGGRERAAARGERRVARGGVRRRS